MSNSSGVLSDFDTRTPDTWLFWCQDAGRVGCPLLGHLTLLVSPTCLPNATGKSHLFYHVNRAQVSAPLALPHCNHGKPHHYSAPSASAGCDLPSNVAQRMFTCGNFFPPHHAAPVAFPWLNFACSLPSIFLGRMHVCGKSLSWPPPPSRVPAFGSQNYHSFITLCLDNITIISLLRLERTAEKWVI